MLVRQRRRPAGSSPLEAKGPQARQSEAGKQTRRQGDNYRQLVRRVFDRADSLWSEYDRLEDELRAPKDPTDVATIRRMLARAEGNCSDASLLRAAAKVAAAEVNESDLGKLSPVRDKANDQLTDEKKRLGRAKQITDADVAARMAQIGGEEYQEAVRSAEEGKRAIEHLGVLVDAWSRRARTLADLLSK